MTVEEASSFFKSTLKIHPLLLLFFSFSYLFLPIRISEAKLCSQPSVCVAIEDTEHEMGCWIREFSKTMCPSEQCELCLKLE